MKGTNCDFLPGDTHLGRNSCLRGSGAYLIVHEALMHVSVAPPLALCDRVIDIHRPSHLTRPLPYTMSQDPKDPSTSSSSPNFETIFTAALKEYKKQTKKDITLHPLAAEIKSCDSPIAVLTVLKSQVQTFDSSESANERWTKLLDPTVTVLYAFSGFVSNIAGPVFPPAAAIFTGIGVLLQAVKDVRATQDILIELFGRVEFFFKRLEAYIKVRPTVAMTGVIVKIMVEVISILGIVTKELRQGRIKKYVKTLFGIRRVADALQRLDKFTQEEALMAAAESLGLAHRIDANVESVGNKVGLINKVETMAEIRLTSKHVSELNQNESRKDLRQWIAPPDPSSNFDIASEVHHEGTTAWCTRGGTFADWKTSGSLLWIHGKPGSGKTILSSVIIRDIESMSNAGSAFLAYFYFDFKDTGKQDSRALLSSLLNQLSNQSDQFRDVLRELYSKHQDGLKKPNDSALLQCLKGMLEIAVPVPVYFVIDALDECPNDSGFPSSRERVLELVEALLKIPHTNLHLCITSRPEFDICTTLGPLASQQLSLHNESGQKQDIIDYVTSVVRSDKKMRRWRDDEKNMVIEKLSEKADGMFRWVFCQLEVLRYCFPNNLRRVLEELPKSLDETYKRILKEINNSNQKQAHHLLQCLSVSSRPLRVEELAEVLALDVTAGGIPKLNAKWRWADHEAAVLSACSSLVSIIIDDGSRVVQFSHFSVKEFLTSDRLASCMEGVSKFHISFEPSHAILAQACLAVLLCLEDRTDEDSVKNIPLHRYASDYWAEHTQVGNVELQLTEVIDYFFDMDKPHFAAYFRQEGGSNDFRAITVSPDEEPTAVLPPVAPLYVATIFGLNGLAGRLITRQPHLIHFCGQDGTPLHWSVREGHIEVARLLFMHGADINSRSPDDSTPLHIALNEGHLEIAKWLLNNGADVNSRTKKGMTPLLFASENRNLEVCRILLERNADVSSPDDHGCTPLHYASTYGTPDMVQLFLDHNSDPHMRDGDGDTILHCAAVAGRLEVARLLLELNAEVNSRNNEGSTPLHRASAGYEEGNPDVVRLLLDHGANSQARNLRGEIPSEVARGPKKQEIVQLLSLYAAE
ncbi:hypothetical protein V8E53_000177 [Lactarius tabidus]